VNGPRTVVVEPEALGQGPAHGRAYGRTVALLDEIRAACAQVAAHARHVAIDRDRLLPYAASLAPSAVPAAPDPETHFVGGSLEDRAAYVITLDAINFGSGWFPTLRKREGRSGYFTLAMGLRDRFAAHGPWSASQLARIEAPEVAAWLGQDARHELMALFAAALRELGARVAGEHRGRYLGLARSTRSAEALVERMATWPTWRDVSDYHGLPVPFFKRAQILAADLVAAGVADYHDLDRLTLFADNLVPHVLRVDGVLRLAPDLEARIEREDLLDHDSPEEVELRACALHAVELLAVQRPELPPHRLDALLWNRGQGPRYKAQRRHRTRCSAY
jgi:hypothetical protein